MVASNDAQTADSSASAAQGELPLKPTLRIRAGVHATRALPVALSIIAGCVDTISFLGLGGLFAAHITGNLVIIAAHVVNGNNAPTAEIFALPVFMAALLLTRLFATGLEVAGRRTLVPLLVLQFLLLAGFLALAAAKGIGPAQADTFIGVVAGMLGVSAMAVQNALVQISLVDTPSTAVMTTNVTRFTVDLGQVLFGHDRGEAAKAGVRAKRILPALLGFAIGCAAGAGLLAAYGLLALALPTGLALLALILGWLSPTGK